MKVAVLGQCDGSSSSSASLPPLFQKAPVEVTPVFKGVFVVLVTNEQGYCINDGRKHPQKPGLCT